MSSVAYINKWRKTESGKASVKRSREKAKEKYRIKQQRYYLRKRVEIIERTARYLKNHPEVRERAKQKNKATGKSLTRGKGDRAELKDHYIVSQICKSTGLPTDIIRSDHQLIELKRAEILVYRIKKEISKNGGR